MNEMYFFIKYFQHYKDLDENFMLLFLKDPSKKPHKRPYNSLNDI